MPRATSGKKGQDTVPASDPELSAPSRDQELHSLMLRWRLRLDPGKIPGLVDSRHRRRGKVSQEEMARMAGVSALWFGYLERGDLERNYSPDFLDRVSFALELSAAERRVLHLLAVAQEPKPKGASHPPQISRALQMTLNCQPWPAWISDPAWHMLVANDATLTWFPHTAWEPNVMLWVFKYPQSQNQLHHWDTVWAPRMLAQMRAALARWPEDEELQALIAETLDVNEFARQWWSTSPEVVMHPDGDQRELYLGAAKEPTVVEIVAQTPMRHPDLRLVEVVPIGGHIPTPQDWAKSDQDISA